MLTEIHSDGAVAQIDTLGAELRSLKDVFGTEYLWQGDARYWTGRSPVLFPIVGKLRGGKYTCHGGEYHLPGHGFARRSAFQLISRQDDRAVFLLSASNDTLAAYPFHFQLEAAYELRGASMTVTFTVRNTGEEEMLFCIGAHPAFNIPLLGGETFEDYFITFERDEEIDTRVVSDAGLFTGVTRRVLTGRSLQMTHALFDHDAIVPVRLRSHKAALASRRSGRGVEMDFGEFRTFAFWSPKGNAPFVCLEPWIGMASDENGSYALEEKRDVLHLDAGKAFEVSYQVRLL